MRRIRQRCFFSIVLFLSGLILLGINTDAKTMTMLYAKENICIHDSEDIESEALLELERGQVVLVLSQNGSWTQVRYQDVQGYVPSADLQTESPVEELSDEMEQLEENDAEVMEAAFQVQSGKKGSVFWGSTIVVIFVGIVILSVIEVRKRK